MSSALTSSTFQGGSPTEETPGRLYISSQAPGKLPPQLWSLGAIVDDTRPAYATSTAHIMSKYCRSCHRPFLFRTGKVDEQDGTPLSFATDACGGTYHFQCAESTGMSDNCYHPGICQFSRAGNLRSSEGMPVDAWAVVVTYDPLVHRSAGLLGQPGSMVEPLVEESRSSSHLSAQEKEERYPVCSATALAWFNYSDRLVNLPADSTFKPAYTQANQQWWANRRNACQDSSNEGRNGWK